jgi:C_GCAxxG_C_C family probable redox protein
LYGVQKALNLDEDTLTVGLAFGGGIAGRQAACGAITGAVAALGMAAAKIYPERAEAARWAREQAQGLYGEFESKYGSVSCRNLTGHDFSAPGGYDGFREDAEALRRCRDYVVFAAEKLAAGVS